MADLGCHMVQLVKGIFHANLAVFTAHSFNYQSLFAQFRFSQGLLGADGIATATTTATALEVLSGAEYCQNKNENLNNNDNHCNGFFPNAQ